MLELSEKYPICFGVLPVCKLRRRQLQPRLHLLVPGRHVGGTLHCKSRKSQGPRAYLDSKLCKRKAFLDGLWPYLVVLKSMHGSIRRHVACCWLCDLYLIATVKGLYGVAPARARPSQRDTLWCYAHRLCFKSRTLQLNPNGGYA